MELHKNNVIYLVSKKNEKLVGKESCLRNKTREWGGHVGYKYTSIEIMSCQEQMILKSVSVMLDRDSNDKHRPIQRMRVRKREKEKESNVIKKA